MSAAVDHRDRAPMTREEAVAAVAEATAERDNIRANLLDLDASSASGCSRVPR